MRPPEQAQKRTITVDQKRPPLRAIARLELTTPPTPAQTRKRARFQFGADRSTISLFTREATQLLRARKRGPKSRGPASRSVSARSCRVIRIVGWRERSGEGASPRNRIRCRQTARVNSAPALTPPSRSLQNDDVLADEFSASTRVKDRAEVAHAQPRLGNHVQESSLLVCDTCVRSAAPSPADAGALVSISESGHAAGLEEKRRQEEMAARYQHSTQFVQVVLGFCGKQMRKE
jgi:hypothetical protein